MNDALVLVCLAAEREGRERIRGRPGLWESMTEEQRQRALAWDPPAEQRTVRV